MFRAERLGFVRQFPGTVLKIHQRNGAFVQEQQGQGVGPAFVGKDRLVKAAQGFRVLKRGSGRAGATRRFTFSGHSFSGHDTVLLLKDNFSRW